MNPAVESGKRKVVVAGGGPAGLTAAGTAARLGADVLLLEKMPGPGVKLSITGKGRCNLTNIAPLDDFLRHFGPDGVFLRQSFGRFFSDDLVRWFESMGVRTVVERGGRVFPGSQDADEVVRGLVRWAEEGGARIRTGARVKSLMLGGGRVAGVRWSAAPAETARDGLTPDRVERADAVIVATGGMSYPATGSTGDGYALAVAAGHTVVGPRPALIPLVTAGDTAQRLQGLSLKNVALSVLIEGKAAAEYFGEMIFTHFGMSGPIVLSASQTAVDALRAGKTVDVSMDLKPALDEAKLDARLLRDFRENGRTLAKNLMKLLMPQKMIPVALDASGIDPEKPGHQISSDERKRLRAWLKDFRLRVTGHRPLSEAIVTAGGVRLKEVDPRTMASRLAEGLYFCGEVLDVNADTGGYNLQAAFSTGRAAGEGAAGNKAASGKRTER
jgi:predicted Rossmann fold flavoprotein